MYEDVTFESIMDSMLSHVPENLDKREGSVIWDALAPAAVEMQNLYIQLDTILNETFADTATLFYLKKRAAERGIEQEKATKAILKGEFVPASLDLPIGTRFNSNDLNYQIVEQIEPGQYKMICETPGEIGNKYFGTIVPIEYIPGLEKADLTELLIPGEDDEDVEHLRKRYFDSMRSQAYGGNIADYHEKTMSIPGVGGVKVIPVWNGGGTVKLIVLDTQFAVPSEDLIDQVQTAIDPVQNQGKGLGIAPIGHVVTVVGVRSVTVNITSNISYQPGWSWESAKSYIEKAVDDYFLDLSKSWDSNENLIVRTSQLESRILNCEGVLDINGTQFNGSSGNLSLEMDQIPVRGTINGN